uniref:TSA: Wollemia nobilis Ref_Wollemi_Transcript_467_1501 transcribed RNA sequence n=1 Tax=Wollemia nobilis TaxID=56998 RepID=A0A0C9RR20_9CONI
MYSKLKEAHLVGKFTSALSRPVLDLGHCGSRGESSVKPQNDSEEEDLGMGVFAEDRTPAQEEALRKLTAALRESGVLRSRDTGLDLVRFLRARSFDVPKAKSMYEAMVEWRREIGADTIKETFHFPERKLIKELYPHFHHKTDKLGQPVYIERLGRLQLEELLKITTLDRMLMYHIKEWEILIDWKFPACSKKAGRTINQSLTILDLKGVTLKHMSKHMRHFVQRISKVDQDYYPEYLGKMVIINAPTTFKAIWSIIKPWLDKRTQKKIEVHGSNYAHRLLDLVDHKNLPEFLGGSCQCPGGCENSDAGPWNDVPFQPTFYEATKA